MASETSRYTWPIDLSFSANTPLCFIRRFNLIEVIARVVQQLVNDMHFHITTCKLCWRGTKIYHACAKLVQTNLVLTYVIRFFFKTFL
jgi:hypothetical protein